jgi:hypothetical protein
MKKLQWWLAALLVVGLLAGTRFTAERSQCFQQCQEIHKLCQKGCAKGDAVCHRECARALKLCHEGCRGASQTR